MKVFTIVIFMFLLAAMSEETYRPVQAYGSCYGAGIAWTQASAVQNTWYLVSDADFVDGPLLGKTHDGNGKLTATSAGVYLINVEISMECS